MSATTPKTCSSCTSRTPANELSAYNGRCENCAMIAHSKWLQINERRVEATRTPPTQPRRPRRRASRKVRV